MNATYMQFQAVMSSVRSQVEDILNTRQPRSLEEFIRMSLRAYTSSGPPSLSQFPTMRGSLDLNNSNNSNNTNNSNNSSNNNSNNNSTNSSPTSSTISPAPSAR